MITYDTYDTTKLEYMLFVCEQEEAKKDAAELRRAIRHIRIQDAAMETCQKFNVTLRDQLSRREAQIERLRATLETQTER